MLNLLSMLRKKLSVAALLALLLQFWRVIMQDKLMTFWVIGVVLQVIAFLVILLSLPIVHSKVLYG